MNRAIPTPNDTPAGRLQQIRHTVVDRIWLGLLIIAILAVPVLLARVRTAGFSALYGVDLGLSFMFIAIYWFRARIAFRVKSALVLLILWSVGLASVFTLGILGTGYSWLVLSSLLVSTLYSMRAGIVTALVVTVVLAIAAFGFTSGVLKVTVDANAYIVSGMAWFGLMIVTTMGPFIIFQAVAAYQQATLRLLEEVHEQNKYIMELATHDHLTGLPVLKLAVDRLEVALHAARRSGRKVALLFIDLDGFKTVNDTFGHEAGDHVLKEVAKCLMTVIRPQDTAARVGGDEFMVVVGGLSDEREAARISERAIAAISRPIDYAGSSMSVGASIGIGLFPDHAGDAQTLRQVADAAMYAVKRGGKNHFAFAKPA